MAICFTCLLLIFLNLASVCTTIVKRPFPALANATHNVKLFMPGVKPIQEEQYTCYAFEAFQPGYIVKFIPTASSARVHHMLLYGCRVPGMSTGVVWNCLHHQVCTGSSLILYAWARNAPDLVLPDDVGVPVGKQVGVAYYVLQVHYGSTFIGNVFDSSGVNLQISEQQPTFVAGIYLLLSGGGPIPPNTASYALNISCEYTNDAVVYPFAYRTHTHSLGRIVSAYKSRNSSWSKIGKGNPQWPQRFYPVDQPVNITKGDRINAQCIFDSTKVNVNTYIGSTGHDEMCNFYMYYYVDARHAYPFGANPVCVYPPSEHHFDRYPIEASKRFEDNPTMNHAAHQFTEKFAITETKNWPSPEISFGQVSGLCMDTVGNLVIFHRADRKWTDRSFNLTNHYIQRTAGPIMDDTVITLNANGSVIKRWGRGFFYMPHGIFVDSQGFLWTTDVAMHQVFKFDPKQPAGIPLLAFGQEFKPGSDQTHFCKPSAVAVLSPTNGGHVFVADGYCNDRVMKFNADGSFLAQFGEKSIGILPSGFPKLGTFTLPHAISVDESNRLLYVADRENFRVQIFDFNGYPTDQLTDEAFGTSVYGVTYCDEADIIYIVNGESTEPKPVDLQVFAFDAKTRQKVFSWKPQSSLFQRPHVVASTQDCRRVFVGEIGPNKVWIFEISSLGPKKITPKLGAVESASTVTEKPGSSKSDKLNEESWLQLVVLLILAIAVPVFCVTAVCCCCRIKNRGGLKGLNLSLQHHYRNSGGASKLPSLTDAFRKRSHKGFQPLRTEDIDALDDLTDDSDADDTVFNKSSSSTTQPGNRFFAPVQNGAAPASKFNTDPLRT